MRLDDLAISAVRVRIEANRKEKDNWPEKKVFLVYMVKMQVDPAFNEVSFNEKSERKI